jgi:hypothetical protein
VDFSRDVNAIIVHKGGHKKYRLHKRAIYAAPLACNNVLHHVPKISDAILTRIIIYVFRRKLRETSLPPQWNDGNACCVTELLVHASLSLTAGWHRKESEDIAIA